MVGTTVYIHTLNNQPATYDGQQICFAMHYGKPSSSCSSLKEIREQQRASSEWRRKRGYLETGWKFGYRRYSVSV